MHYGALNMKKDNIIIFGVSRIFFLDGAAIKQDLKRQAGFYT